MIYQRIEVLTGSECRRNYTSAEKMRRLFLGSGVVAV